MPLTKTLLPQRNTLQLLQSILLRSTVDNRVLQQRSLCSIVIHRGLALGPTAHILLDLPRVPPFAVHQAREVVALVEVLEHRGEDLGRLVGQGDALAGIEGVVLEEVVEVRGAGEDVFVGGEDALFVAYNEGNNRADAAAAAKCQL